MSDQLLRSEADSVHEQAILGLEPVRLDPGVVYAIRTLNGFEVIDGKQESVLRAAGLKRLQPVSGYAFHNITSFTSYINSIFSPLEEDPMRRGNKDSYSSLREHALCIADVDAFTIRLIFDAQPDQWGTVYADLKLQLSHEAERWQEASGKYLEQQAFAEFCELNLSAFCQPAAATILEIAQTFQAKTTVDFSSAVRLSSGAIKLKREEKVDATAGERADISIPEELRIALPLFRYDKTYEVRARLRYRVQNSSVKLSVLLIDPELAIEHAFCQVAGEVSTLLNMPVFYGKI
jgi:hypothetical protein